MKRNKIIRKPSEWQMNPENVKTEYVQFWSDGCMMTAQMTREIARKRVAEGNAFVISEQAIGRMIDGSMCS